jgi:hypothetical protein
MRIVRLATAALAILVVVGVPRALGAVPLPEDDPFFAVPPSHKLAGKPNGAVLKARPVELSTLGTPIAATAWQLEYKTIDVHGQPSAYGATLMIPDVPWDGPGPRPLVSYQTAEDGVGSKCSPSYALSAGPEAADSNSAPEANAMNLALNRGWAVVAPDYEGPRSEFLGVKGQARGVIDGVRAALRYRQGGLAPHRTPVGLWGYSGGALASSFAAQLQPRYAPDLRLTGVALGGVPGDMYATMRAFSGGAAGGGIVVGLVGIDRSYPRLNLTTYLNDAGRSALANSQTDCIGDSVAKYPGAKIEDFLTDPAVLQDPRILNLFKRISPLWFRGTPQTPVYDYHAVFDELAPIGPDRQLVARYCAEGVTVQHYEDYTSEHVSLLASNAPAAMDWFGDRFAGLPAPTNC